MLKGRDDVEPPEIAAETFQLIELAAKLTRAYLDYNHATLAEAQLVLTTSFKAMRELANGHDAPATRAAKKSPAVPISKSITDNFIICLEDGHKLRTLKRYLRSRFKLTPHEYRERWNLPSDYPMVAPSYTRRRSELAKMIGLGRGSRGRPPVPKGKRR